MFGKNQRGLNWFVIFAIILIISFIVCLIAEFRYGTILLSCVWVIFVIRFITKYVLQKRRNQKYIPKRKNQDYKWN